MLFFDKLSSFKHAKACQFVIVHAGIILYNLIEVMKMYSLKDVMEMFKIPERTIRRHLKEGILKGSKMGGLWKFTEEDLKDYLKSKCVQKHMKDEGFKIINNYYNGYVENKTDVLFMFMKSFEKPENLERFMEVSKLLEKEFSLAIRKSHNFYVCTFKGQTSDLLILMKWGEAFERNI